MEAKAPFADCAECPLRDEPHVLGAGPDKPRIVVVGEAPGRDEVKSGIPFIGRSGQLLNRVLDQHGIEREEVYVTNTVLCRPPGNRTPTANEIRHCRARLVAEINGKAPQAVLALGAPASKTLLGTKQGITTLRIGGMKRSPELNAPVVATFHPAAALRNPDYFPSIVQDVGKLTHAVELRWEPTKIDVFDDFEAAQYALALQVKYPLVSLDMEYAPPFSRHHPDILCMGTSHMEGKAYVFTKRVCDDLRFRKLLDQAFMETRWGFQNGKGDIQRLWGAGISNARVDEDTMLGHALTDERKGTHSLEQLATEFLGAPNYKTEVKVGLEDDQDFSKLPPDILYRYQGTDADVTQRLHPIMRKSMVEDNVLGVYETLTIPGANVLAKTEYKGIAIDLEFLDSLDEELTNSLSEMEQTTSQWVANPRSPTQIKRAFGDILSEDFDQSTNKLQLTIIIEKDPESEAADLARAILAYREAHKEHSTYVKGMKKRLEGGRIHSQFNLHIAETGRLSSSKPNMQNIKQGRLRNMFVADPGHVLLSADYSAIELRVASVFFKELDDSWLFDQFMQNRPLHKEMATRLFGEGYSERQYVQGKTTTFSILYEVGAPSLAARLRISNRAAENLISGWKANVPGLERYWASIREQINTQAHLRSRYGRVRRFWLITDDNRHEVYKQGYNFPIQSPASDICLRSLITLGPVTQPVITVHDSITFQIPEEELTFQQRHIQRVMEDVPDWEVPMPVEIKVGHRWS